MTPGYHHSIGSLSKGLKNKGWLYPSWTHGSNCSGIVVVWSIGNVCPSTGTPVAAENYDFRFKITHSFSPFIICFAINGILSFTSRVHFSPKVVLSFTSTAYMLVYLGILYPSLCPSSKAVAMPIPWDEEKSLAGFKSSSSSLYLYSFNLRFDSISIFQAYPGHLYNQAF